MTAQALKYLIQDAEDLEAVALHTQDSILRAGDIRYLPRERRVVLMLNRFRWELAARRFRFRPLERVRAGLHFDGVLAMRARGIAQDKPDDPLVLLSIGFAPQEPPGGTIRLDFAGGGSLSLDVECIDGALADVSPPWVTAHRPRHDDDGNG